MPKLLSRERFFSFSPSTVFSPCFYCGAKPEHVMMFEIDEVTDAFGLPYVEDDMIVCISVCDDCATVEGEEKYSPKFRSLVMTAIAEVK